MRVVFDLAVLIARVTIGAIFVAHGWQKWQNGLGPTSQMFAQAGVPQPELVSGITTMAELVGGSFLIIGLLTRLAALALLCISVAAIAFVHGKNGIFVGDLGWEFVATLGAACLLLLAVGAGRISMDGIVSTILRRRAAKQALPEPTGTVTPTTTMPATVHTVRAVPQTETEPRPEVPRQSAPPPATGTGTAPNDDMKALDALMSNDQPKKNPPERVFLILLTPSARQEAEEIVKALWKP
ncbi:DoxX family protein [Nonomuraea endophytica]|uniref:Putative oxidoreductase n=1 Tax=Nonomuraea endophytica TaxID=714136 RepID=A0A7W8ACB6_9ACTN|nr:DoxX family protein [Nonomuraea endophytica]MBB5083671.1 putative oxidoreductase [Nonomuraea endophytica]